MRSEYRATNLITTDGNPVLSPVAIPTVESSKSSPTTSVGQLISALNLYSADSPIGTPYLSKSSSPDALAQLSPLDSTTGMILIPWWLLVVIHRILQSCWWRCGSNPCIAFKLQQQLLAVTVLHLIQVPFAVRNSEMLLVEMLFHGVIGNHYGTCSLGI